jgi:hypothetical protein
MLDGSGVGEDVGAPTRFDDSLNWRLSNSKAGWHTPEELQAEKLMLFQFGAHTGF